jgi:hypothetical protein
VYGKGITPFVGGRRGGSGEGTGVGIVSSLAGMEAPFEDEEGYGLGSRTSTIPAFVVVVVVRVRWQ